MRKIFTALITYSIIILGGFLAIQGIGKIIGQTNPCYGGSNENDSFLSEWLDITYFEEKERHEACIQRSDTYGLYKNLEEKELACKIRTHFQVCNDPNFKPGIIYGILGILILTLGIKLRKKYGLNISQ